MRILITGGSGFIGRRLVEALRETDDEVLAPTHRELDLEGGGATHAIVDLAPDLIYHLAVFSGGVHFVASRAAEVAWRNLKINRSLIDGCELLHVSKPDLHVVVAGSACMYAANLNRPAIEEECFDGALHPSVETIGHAKRQLLWWARIRGYSAAILTTVYGPGAMFLNATRAHFLDALVGRFEEARRLDTDRVFVWGSGKPIRDVVYIDDAVSALRHIAALHTPRSDALNVSSGEAPRSIAQFAEAVRTATGFKNAVVFDPTRGDGQLYKAVDTSKIQYTGWHAEVMLEEGLRRTVASLRREGENV